MHGFQYEPLEIVPVSQKAARAFINRHHRHNVASGGAIFCVGLQSSKGLVAVAMAGIPVARMLMDGRTLEVTRVCTVNNTKNANSMIYAACARAAKALGYKRIITYTLQEESGISLKAAGWKICGEVNANRKWDNRPNRLATVVDLFGDFRAPMGAKYRWELNL